MSEEQQSDPLAKLSTAADTLVHRGHRFGQSAKDMVAAIVEYRSDQTSAPDVEDRLLKALERVDSDMCAVMWNPADLDQLGLSLGPPRPGTVGAQRPSLDDVGDLAIWQNSADLRVEAAHRLSVIDPRGPYDASGAIRDRRRQLGRLEVQHDGAQRRLQEWSETYLGREHDRDFIQEMGPKLRALQTEESLYQTAVRVEMDTVVIPMYVDAALGAAEV